MFFNKPFMIKFTYCKTYMLKLLVLLGLSVLIGCASKQPVTGSNPQLEAERLQTQSEQAQFLSALALIQSDNAEENDLITAKAVFDKLYNNNKAYLGALLNSADLSLRLERLDEAKALFTDALSQIEQQLNPPPLSIEPSDTSKTKDSSEQYDIPVSGNIELFQIHSLNQLGLIARQQGRFDDAEAFYKQALTLDANQAITLKNLAILLDLYRGKLAEALMFYEQYQIIVGDSDPKAKDWIYDIKNRLPAEETSNE